MAPEFVHQLGGIHGAQSAGHVVAGDSLEAGTVNVCPSWVKVTVLLPAVMSTIPGACFLASWYSAGLSRPSRWCANWSAMATTPANSGVASLVPPKM